MFDLTAAPTENLLGATLWALSATDHAILTGDRDRWDSLIRWAREHQVLTEEQIADTYRWSNSKRTVPVDWGLCGVPLCRPADVTVTAGQTVQGVVIMSGRTVLGLPQNGDDGFVVFHVPAPAFAYRADQALEEAVQSAMRGDYADVAFVVVEAT
ncbi:hypothetical protein [Nocardia sp. A7]|uniref:hypothetical protein n=1 Tax=Nocardia sp. A7 TaxID=2789274 RepID=UPI00397D59AE